jgi:hypothetical protein
MIRPADDSDTCRLQHHTHSVDSVTSVSAFRLRWVSKPLLVSLSVLHSSLQILVPATSCRSLWYLPTARQIVVVFTRACQAPFEMRQNKKAPCFLGAFSVARIS